MNSNNSSARAADLVIMNSSLCPLIHIGFKSIPVVSTDFVSWADQRFTLLLASEMDPDLRSGDLLLQLYYYKLSQTWFSGAKLHILNRTGIFMGGTKITFFSSESMQIKNV